jgi:hypothetical protein
MMLFFELAGGRLAKDYNSMGAAGTALCRIEE